MTVPNPFQLIDPAAFDSLIADVRRQVEGCPRTGSRYQDLAHLSRVHQELGNALSKLIYEAASAALPQGLACRRGCSTCCHIPSAVREVEESNFTMSILDAVTLIESYADIKAADPSVPERAIDAFARARDTKGLVPCPHLGPSGECGIYERRPVVCKIWFSADLAVCRRSRDLGYPVGANPWTVESNRLRVAFEAPFIERIDEIAPELEFGEHDFLKAMADIAKLDRRGLFGAFREKVDAGELCTWDPFDGPDAHESCSPGPGAG
jgi:Fe-S-cluster containining protein